MKNSPMFYGATPTVFSKATMLRNNTTKEEKLLWAKLKVSTLFFNKKWRRQHPINIYVADFYCHAVKLVIEVDGKDHKYQFEKDQEREEIMKGFGIVTIRFSNTEINTDFVNVLLDIKKTMKEIELENSIK